MKWKKLGLIFAPSGELWWAKSHAYLPTVDLVDPKIIRVYFAGLDTDKIGRIGYVDLDAYNPQRILNASNEPILDIGDPGTFDDSGVSPSCMINVNGKKYFYYIGWQRAQKVPYMLFAGLAISDGSNAEFNKYSRVPILDRTKHEPFTRSATTVIEENGNFKMWYVSALDWITIEGKLYPTYVARYTDSYDGVNWHIRNDICINFESPDEFGFGRPWVIKDGSDYKMWYSIRSRTKPYRMGYAESMDGLNWVRKDDQVGIIASGSGWDSEMICFPCIVDANGKRYMFYNGNRHGETGFGCAILESE